MNIFLINLDSAKLRLQFQRQQLQQLSLPFYRLNATSADDIDTETHQRHSQDWNRPLSKTELACYFSHRHAWESIITLDKPALILEDDALLSTHTPNLLTALERRTDTDFINLEAQGRKVFVSRTGEDIGCKFKLYTLYQNRHGAAGYILWPSGAQKLLQHERKNGIALADAHITSCYRLAAYQVEPAAIIQLNQCQHYAINVKNTEELQTSSVSAKKNNKGGVKFRFKRITSQMKLGLHQLNLCLKSTRRPIQLRRDDFSPEK